MELYRKVRLACRDGMSERAAARHFGVSRQSVRKMLQFSVPPGYRRTAPVRRPKLDEFTGLIEQWLEDDRRHGYRKQRHTAKRIFERLRDEHGFTGGYTIVKDYVREHRRHRREMFVPLTHPPGHAQADFGEAWAVIAGVKQKVHFFAFDLPQSDASYVRAYRAATAEAWVDGHVHAFSFFGAVALSIVYDNDRCLVSRIERDGTRRRTRLFSGFLSHYLNHKLLIIDELGFVPLSKTGAELLFELVSQRYERAAVLITSNLPFDEWTETFGTERLTGALLDRLTHHVHILELNGQSFRLNHSRARNKGSTT